MSLPTQIIYDSMFIIRFYFISVIKMFLSFSSDSHPHPTGVWVSSCVALCCQLKVSQDKDLRKWTCLTWILFLFPNSTFHRTEGKIGAYPSIHPSIYHFSIFGLRMSASRKEDLWNFCIFVLWKCKWLLYLSCK